MKVSGFTIIRNAIKFDYPIVEAITSILSICDEFIVLVGNSEDDTKKLIESIESPKIKIIDSVWDDTLREGGKVLSVETNKALSYVSADSDWCFYIQADECVHEKYLPIIKAGMGKWKEDDRVEGLLFNYTHFYGSYDYVGDSSRWYRNEIRVIRNNKSIVSYGDAQGFRNKNNEKLKVKLIDAHIYHYGWVKPPKMQQAKQKTFHKYWHDEKWMEKNVAQIDEFDYSKIDSLQKFTGTHPAVYTERIKNKNWTFSFDPITSRQSLKEMILQTIEKYTGWRIGEYKNYILLK